MYLLPRQTAIRTPPIESDTDSSNTGSLGSFGEFCANRLYLPSSGTPAITPAYETLFWDDVSAATRRPGSIMKRAGTSYTTETFPISHFDKVLFYQYVIPLRGTGAVNRKGATLLSGSHQLLCHMRSIPVSGSAEVVGAVISISKLYNQAGTLLSQRRVIPITVGVGSDTSKITSAGLFLPSDAGQSIYLLGVYNFLLPGGSFWGLGENGILSVQDASNATVSAPYGLTSPALGAHSAWITQEVGMNFTYTSALLVDDTAGVGNCVLGNAGMHTWMQEACYLVVEIGAQYTLGSKTLISSGPPPTTAIARTLEFRLGDPTLETLLDDPSSSTFSSGGGITYYRAPRILR